MASTTKNEPARITGRFLPSRSMRWSANLSVGEKSLILYFAAFYYFPMLADFFLDIGIKYHLRGDLEFFIPFLFSILYLSALLVLRRAFCLDIKIKAPFRGVMGSHHFFFVVFTIFLASSLFFSMQFESSFRHTDSYSDAGILPIITFSLKMICHVIIFASISAKQFVRLRSVHYMMYLAGIFFSFVSSYDILWAAVALYAWSRTARVDAVRIARKVFARFGLFWFVMVIPVVVFGGMLNKIGLEGAIKYFSDDFVTTFFQLFTNRIFYHSYSLAIHFSDFAGSFALSSEAMNIVSHQSFRRFLVLIGHPVPSETLQTVSRLNYLVISGNNIESDAGASPGMLASIFYLPGSFLALPIHMICISNAVSMIDNIMGRSKYGYLTYFGSLALLQALTDAFMDNFNPFSIGFIVLATMFYMSSYARTIPDPADPKR